MALTADRVIVELEAKVGRYNSNVIQAERLFAGSMNRTAASASRMERSVGSSFKGMGLIFSAIIASQIVRGSVGLIDAFTRVENALKISGHTGEELTGVFNRLSAAASKNGAPLEALVQVYRSGALASKELGVSTEELLRFTEGVAAGLRVSGKSAEESRGALIQLSQAIGGTIVRAEEFNAILEGAAPIAQTVARGLTEAGGSVAKLRLLVINGEVSSKAFFEAFRAGQDDLEGLAETSNLTVGQSLENLRTKLINVAGRLNDATGASYGLKTAIEGLGNAAEVAVDALIALGGPLDKIAQFVAFLEKLDPVSTHLSGAQQKVDELIAKQKVLAELTKETFPEPSVSDTVIRNRIEQAFGGEIAPVSIKDFPAGSAAGGNKKSPAGKAEDDLRTIRERTAAIIAETRAVGKSRFEQERSAAALDLEQELRKDGIVNLDNYRDKINKEAEAYANATVSLEAMQLQYEKMQELQQFLGDQLTSVFDSIADGSFKAEDALEQLASALSKAVIQASVLGQGPLAGLFGTTGAGGGIGGLIGSLFRGGGRGLTGAGLFARGGITNRPSIAGENGPEAVVPLPDGRRIPVALKMAGDSAMRTAQEVRIENHFHDNVGLKIKTNESRTTNGGLRIDYILDEMAASHVASPGSRTNKALRNSGMPQPLTGR